MFAPSAFRWLDSAKESRAGRAKATGGLEAPPVDESGTSITSAAETVLGLEGHAHLLLRAYMYHNMALF